MIIAAILGSIGTLVEVYAPKRIKAYLPSVTGMGLGFVVSGFDSISMFLGAALAIATGDRTGDGWTAVAAALMGLGVWLHATE